MNAEHLDFFAAHIGTHAQNVALIGGNQGHFILLEEACQRIKGFVRLLADLDGKHHVFPILEAKGHQRMCNGGPHPVRQRHVHTVKLVQVIAARFPARGEIGFTAPVKVAHIAQLHHSRLCSIGFHHDQMLHIGRPVQV